MNVMTVAEIKRNGFAALETALADGPVHLMKRNRPSAVVLRAADYEALLAQAQRGRIVSASGLNQFLAPDESAISDGLDSAALRDRIAELAAGWDRP